MSNQIKPTHHIVYKGHEFTGDDGKKRYSYPIIGAAWPGEDGNPNRLVIDSLPVNFNGVLYLRPRKIDDDPANQSGE